MLLLTNGIKVLVALVTFFTPTADSSPYIISDDRVRSLDVTPVLGRGYSIMTNSFQSTCLTVSETTVPSYNYDYTFSDFSSSTTSTRNVQQTKTVSNSFSFWWISRSHSSTSTTTTNTKIKKQTRMMVAIMRLERYYSSVREEEADLTADAVELLDRQDYVGFFKSCGPNYVRGIRRAQEVTAIFKWEESSTETSKEYAARISTYRRTYWRRGRSRSNPSSKSKYTGSNSSLEISIRAYGLGLGDESSDTLVATNLEEYQAVMHYAFRQMTQNKDSYAIGQVYGIEVVPWVDSTMYQVASNIGDEIIEVPQPRSLIPRATQKTDLGNSTGFDNGTNRDDYTCKDESFSIDKYGYCCDASELYDANTDSYDSATPEDRVCKPLRQLDKTLIKNNLASNGEFVARLDRAVRYKLNQMSLMERCISAARALPARYDPYILKHKDTVKYDENYDPQFTVQDLKLALDPFGDYSFLKHMGQELDEFLEMFYAPCMAALFGSNIGTNPDTDPTFFMAYPWHTHKECLYLSCFANGMRWDRVEGGCTPGLITGKDAPAYAGDLCAYDNESSGTTQTCKYPLSDQTTFHTQVVACWQNTIPAGRVDYFLDSFCLPDVTEDKVSPSIEAALRNEAMQNCDRDSTIDGTVFSAALHLVNQGGKHVTLKDNTCLAGTKAVTSDKKHFYHPSQKFEYNYKTQAFVLRGFDTDSSPCKLALAVNTNCDGVTFENWTVNVAGDLAERMKFVYDKDKGMVKSVDCDNPDKYLYVTGNSFNRNDIELTVDEEKTDVGMKFNILFNR